MMAAFTGSSKGTELSKAEYLKRYLSADGEDKKSKGKLKKKRRKVIERGWVFGDDLANMWLDSLCLLAG